MHTCPPDDLGNSFVREYEEVFKQASSVDTCANLEEELRNTSTNVSRVILQEKPSRANWAPPSLTRTVYQEQLARQATRAHGSDFSEVEGEVGTRRFAGTLVPSKVSWMSHPLAYGTARRKGTRHDDRHVLNGRSATTTPRLGAFPIVEIVEEGWQSSSAS